MKYYLTLALILMLTACGSTLVVDRAPSLAMILTDSVPEDEGAGTFSTALRQDSLADVRKLLIEADGPYTAFVPTNTAFETYFKARGITEEAFMESSELPEFIRTYIAPGNYYPKTLFETDNLSFKNLNGDTLAISRRGDDFYVNDALIDGPILRDTKKQDDGAFYNLLSVIEP